MHNIMLDSLKEKTVIFKDRQVGSSVGPEYKKIIVYDFCSKEIINFWTKKICAFLLKKRLLNNMENFYLTGNDKNGN